MATPMESVRLALPRLLSLSPLEFLAFMQGHHNGNWITHLQRSFATLAAASLLRSSITPDPNISVSGLELESLLEGITLDIQSNGPSSDDLGELHLIVFGFPGGKDQNLPLERKSDTKWMNGGAMVLPEDLPDLTFTVVSNTLGDIGCGFVSGPEMTEAKSWNIDEPNMVTRSIIASDPDAHEITISFVVWPFVVDATVTTCKPASAKEEEGPDIFNHTWDAAKIEEQIAALRQRLSTPSWPAIEKIEALIRLSTILQKRFQLQGIISDINESVTCAECAIQAIVAGTIPGSESKLPRAMYTLGTSLARRYEDTKIPADINRAIQILRQTANETSESHPSLGARAWCLLGSSLVLRAQEHDDDIRDLEDGVSAGRKALEVLPPGNNLKAELLCGLGSSCHTLFTRSRSLDHLEESLKYLREGLSLDDPDDPQLGPEWQCNLGYALIDRYSRDSDLEHLNEAIKILQASMRSPNRISLLPVASNLAGAFIRRFAHTHEMDSLYEAIDLCQKALSTVKDEHSYWYSLTLANMAVACSVLFGVTRSVEDIRKAISIQEKVVETSQTTLAHSIGQLGQYYSLLYEVTNNPEDNQRAIDTLRRAVDSWTPSNPYFVSFPSHLGLALLRRYVATHDIADVHEAISTIELSLNLSVVEGPKSWAAVRTALAKALFLRFSALGDSSDVDRAVSLLSSIVSSQTISSEDRIQAARGWAMSMSLAQRDPAECLEAYEALVQLVTILAGLERTVKIRYAILSGYSPAVLQAAVTAIRADRVDKAVEWLEQGRGLVWAQLNSLRTPVDILRSHNSGLAERLEMVSKKLEVAGSQTRIGEIQASLDKKMDLHEQASAHFKLAKEREEVLKTIRTTVPGFENFLKPLPCDTLLENLPDSGPVIIINVHPAQCDAIALLSGIDEPFHIPLSTFSYAKAEELGKALKASLVENRVRKRGDNDNETDSDDDDDDDGDMPPDGNRAIKPRNKVLRLMKPSPLEDVLQQLWVDVCRPIVDALALSRCDDGSIPELRVWWCPTGPLTFLPIHAAGIYRGAKKETLAEYAISSYIPTVGVLAEQLQKQNRQTPESKSGLLLLSEPGLPGSRSYIPGTTTEVSRISKRVEESGSGIRTLRLEGAEATVEAGLQGMQNYSCIHLACHATQNAQEPLKSGFHLRDGRLELETIIKSDLDAWADLAFLSACQTSTGTENLSEEAVHLAAGMLAAGYRGVVATMWSIQDVHAPQLADDFYTQLFGVEKEAVDDGEARTTDDDGKVNAKRVEGANAARALHCAVRQLRRRIGDSESSFMAWVPYVHFGL